MVAEEQKLASCIAYFIRCSKCVGKSEVTDKLTAALQILVDRNVANQILTGSHSRPICLFDALALKGRDVCTQTTVNIITETECEALCRRLVAHAETKIRELHALVEVCTSSLQEKDALIDEMREELSSNHAVAASGAASGENTSEGAHWNPNPRTLKKAGLTRNVRQGAGPDDFATPDAAMTEAGLDLVTLREQHQEHRLAEKAARRLARTQT